MSDYTVLERLAKLERSNRRLRAGLAVCGAALVCMVVIGAERATPLLTTEYLRLVDTEGKLRGAMGSDQDGTFFFLNDPAGKMRASIAAQKLGSYVSLKDPEGKTRVVVTFDEAGPAVRLKDEEGANVAVVSADQDGSWLEVRDADGRSRVLSTLSDSVTEPKKAGATGAGSAMPPGGPVAPPAGGAKAPAPGGSLPPGAPRKYDN